MTGEVSHVLVNNMQKDWQKLGMTYGFQKNGPRELSPPTRVSLLSTSSWNNSQLSKTTTKYSLKCYQLPISPWMHEIFRHTLHVNLDYMIKVPRQETIHYYSTVLDWQWHVLSMKHNNIIFQKHQRACSLKFLLSHHSFWIISDFLKNHFQSVL